MRVFGWIRPHIPEASDGILTSAGICEGFAGAGVGSRVLFFAGFAGLVAGTLAMGAVEYSKLRAEHDQQVGELAAERVRLETAPDAELDELTGLYVSRGLSPGLARQVAVELTAHDALAAHAEAEYGITAASRIDPLREALAVSDRLRGRGLAALAGDRADPRADQSARDLCGRAGGAGADGMGFRADFARPAPVADGPHGEHRRPGDADYLSRRTPSPSVTEE